MIGGANGGGGGDNETYESAMQQLQTCEQSYMHTIQDEDHGDRSVQTCKQHDTSI